MTAHDSAAHTPTRSEMKFLQQRFKEAFDLLYEAQYMGSWDVTAIDRWTDEIGHFCRRWEYIARDAAAVRAESDDTSVDPAPGGRGPRQEDRGGKRPGSPAKGAVTRSERGVESGGLSGVAPGMTSPEPIVSPVESSTDPLDAAMDALSQRNIAASERLSPDGAYALVIFNVDYDGDVTIKRVVLGFATRDAASAEGRQLGKEGHIGVADGWGVASVDDKTDDAYEGEPKEDWRSALPDFPQKIPNVGGIPLIKGPVDFDWDPDDKPDGTLVDDATTERPRNPVVGQRFRDQFGIVREWSGKTFGWLPVDDDDASPEPYQEPRERGEDAHYAPDCNLPPLSTHALTTPQRPDWTCGCCGRVWRHNTSLGGGYWEEIQGPRPSVSASDELAKARAILVQYGGLIDDYARSAGYGEPVRDFLGCTAADGTGASDG